MTPARQRITPSTPGRPTRWMVLMDMIALAFFVLGVWVVVTGGMSRAYVYGIRVSMSYPHRALLIGLAILAVRHWLDPRHPRILQAIRSLRDLKEFDEARLFGRWDGSRWVEFLAVSVGFIALVGASTWPQIRDASSVPDLGDPLFSAWRLGWIAHALATAPSQLFDGNAFYPERLTLTYSDSVLFPGLVGAPFVWLGVPLIKVYNYLFLGGFAFSGVATYYLVRALTGRRDAALVAGAVFAVYPYRFEHYSHLELAMTMWTPLTLLMLHRAIAGRRVRDGVGMGISYALQMYSCMYLALFLAVYLVPLALTLWLARRRPIHAIRSVGAGLLIAAVLILPLAQVYLSNRPMVGERSKDEILFYSARPHDYLSPHQFSRLYGGWATPERPERQLFPGLASITLGVIGLWPPFSVARVGYALSGLLAFDASLGYHSVTYPILHDFISPYRGLRVASRFSILVGCTLSILAGYAMIRLYARWPRQRHAITAAALALVFLDTRPTLPLTPVWESPPAIYTSIPAGPTTVLADFPTNRDEGRDLLGFRYMYFSTFRWYRILDGNSGFLPVSWDEYIKRTMDFPGDASLGYLRSRGVQYFTVHGAFYDNPEGFAEIQRRLAKRTDVEKISSTRFSGSTSELYRLK